jgi:hypothetical protein
MTLLPAPVLPGTVRDPDDRVRRLRALAVVAGVLAGVPVVGYLAATRPSLGVAAVLGTAVVVVVWWRPEVTAYLIVGVTPLVVGIDRDRLVPMLRPNEALIGLLIAVLCARAAVRARSGTLPRVSLGPLAWSLVGFAVASSVVPIAFMVLRGRTVEMDDITYAAVMWKFLALYALVRLTVRTDRQLTITLWVSLVSAALVGVIGILQSLDLLGVRGLLVPWYAPFGYTAGVTDSRAGSTVGLPAATADLMVLNLVVALGLVWRRPRLAWVLGPLCVVYTMAVFSAAEFSSILGLLIAGVTVAARLRRLDLLKYGLLVLPVAVVVLWPTISVRLVEFSSMHGMPTSWLVRYRNLETYFWPQVFDGSNFLVGVRPAARVPVVGAFGYVWIESGYTWLLWGGGIPLLAAFVWFVREGLRATGPASRDLTAVSSVPALAAYAGLVSCVVLMLFDPHITYRGSADALFALLALAACGSRGPTQGPRPGPESARNPRKGT